MDGKRTYRFSKDRRSIECLKCGRVSHNANDVRMAYCAKCGFHNDDLLRDMQLYIFVPGSIAPCVAGACRLPAEPSNEDLHAVLDPYFDRDGEPRYFEHVAVLYRSQPADMFVDETGAIDGLPRNEPATKLYRASWLNAHPQDDPESLPFIAGPAVITGRRVWF